MKMVNLPVCDLRNIKTVEAAKEIECIRNCAVLILPKDGDEELLTALAVIPKENIASTIALGASDNVVMQNGVGTVTAGMLRTDEETVYIINGVAIVEAIPAEKKCTLSANGVVVLHEANRKESGIKLGTVNGATAYADFDHSVVQEDSFEVDADFLKYAKPKTLLVAGDTIYIEDDVTVEMLEEKLSYMVAGDTIRCPKAVAGYVRANATAGDGIKVR